MASSSGFAGQTFQRQSSRVRSLESRGNPEAYAVESDIVFIQESITAGGLATVAGKFLELDLITRQNYDDSLAVRGGGPLDQAVILMKTVKLKIRTSPGVYFPRFTKALRLSSLDYVAEKLEQALSDCQQHEHSTSDHG